MKLIRRKSAKGIPDLTDQKVPDITEQYPLAHTDYNIIGIIGKGAFAKVYGAQCIPKNNKKVAIKVIRLEQEDELYPPDIKPIQIEDIQQEASVMAQMKHINIVSCYVSFVVRDELWLIMPFISGGSCAYVLDHSKDHYFVRGIKDEGILACLLRDCLSGLIYMHNQGRIHRDIKGRNILLSAENGRAMLADFGVSGALLEGGLKKRGRNTMTGTPCWMSPEVMKHEKYDYKADIWSLGITALELAFGTTPYTKLNSPMKVMMEIMDGKPPTCDSMDKDNKFSKHFKTFIAGCCAKDPAKRLSAKELFQSQFIVKYSEEPEYMIKNFIPHIKKITIKQCAENDMPVSLIVQARLIKQKSKKMQMRIDGVEGEGGDDIDHDPFSETEKSDFNFSTSLTINSVDDLKDESDTPQTKSKFMVSQINEETDTDAQAQPPKKSRFQVTSMDQ